MWLKDGGRGRCSEDSRQVPSHAGLGYTRCAPLAVLRKTQEEREDSQARKEWLDLLTQCRLPKGYERAFHRWVDSFQGPDTLCFTVRAESRVLIGHGTSSATEVGLTLHHTWGVPVLPGSALKGLTAQYVQTVYGPELGVAQPEREPFRGTTWKDSRPVRPPGDVFRGLFGAPDVDAPEVGGSQGKVIFHDALWVPAQGAMLARDVLTVHQRVYYEGGGKHWPVDYDAPNPVSFLTVAPAQRFFVALEARGDRTVLERAARYLCEALASWGVGGKTVAGYGRFIREAPEPPSPRRPAAPAMRSPESPVLKAWSDWLEDQKARQVLQRQQFQQVEREWTERLLTLAQPERLEAARLLKKALNLKREDEKQRLDELLARLRE